MIVYFEDISASQETQIRQLANQNSEFHTQDTRGTLGGTWTGAIGRVIGRSNMVGARIRGVNLREHLSIGCCSRVSILVIRRKQIEHQVSTEESYSLVTLTATLYKPVPS